MSNFLDGLNNEQRKAVDYINGPFLCIAGPGSGKTFTLVRRVLNLIEHDVDPDKILVVTFSRNAAKEMKERYEALDGSVQGPSFGTIHSLSLSIIRDAYGYTSNDIISEGEKRDFVRHLLDDTGGRDRTTTEQNNLVAKILADFGAYAVTEIKTTFIPKSVKPLSAFLPLYNEYQKYKEENHLIDFEDMLFKCREALQDKSILNKWQKKFTHIMIDEFQDTSKVQADILYTLAAPNNNIFIAGDDDQSIYEFRAARPDIMLNFPNEFKGCGIARLTINYRSDKKIIETAGEIIKNNKQRFDKNIIGAKAKEGRVELYSAKDKKDQTRLILTAINDFNKVGIAYKSMAILCRTNQEVSFFAKKCSDNNIPFYSPDMLTNSHETWLFNVIFSYLKICYKDASLSDYKAIMNKPMRYFSTSMIRSFTSIQNLKAEWQNDKKVMSRIEWFERDIRDISLIPSYYNDLGGVVSYISKLLKFNDMIHDHCAYAFLDEDYYLTLLKDIQDEASMFKSYEQYKAYIEEDDCLFKEKMSGNYNGVTISTIHRAKGLEWDTVFIPSCKDGNIPYIPREEAGKKLPREEERRLFYVAMTRAKHNCFLFNEMLEIPSPYLKEGKLLKPYVSFA